MSASRHEGLHGFVHGRSPRRRLHQRLPRYTRGKNPFFSRSGNNSIGGPLPAGRGTRGLAWIVFLLLLVMAGRWYVTQRLSVSRMAERVIRTQLIPQFESKYGEKLEVGSVTSDWLSRIVVHDVVVGRDPTLPTGALARARSITLNVDLFGLAVRHLTPMEALRGVEIDSPEFFVDRNDQGVWRLARLFSGKTGPSLSGWNGSVGFHNGRVFLLDRATRNAQGQPLMADIYGIQGGVTANGGTYRWTGTAGTPTLGPHRQVIGPVTTHGELSTAPLSLAAAVDLPPVPAPLLCGYAFPGRQVEITSGSAAGEVQVEWDGTQLLPRGQIQLNGLTGTVNTVKLPRAVGPLAFQDVRGPLAFSGEAASSTQLTGTVFGSQITLSGAAGLLDKPVLDVRALAKSFEPGRVLPALYPLAPGLRQLKSAPVDLDVTVTGPSDDLTFNGSARTSGLNWTAPASHIGAGPAQCILETRLVTTSSGARTADVALRFSAAAVSADGMGKGGRRWRTASPGITGTLQSGSGRLALSLGTGAWTGAVAPYGAISGGQVTVTGTSTNSSGTWRGHLGFDPVTLTGISRDALPELARRVIGHLGTVAGGLDFSAASDLGLKSLQTHGALRLRQFAVALNRAGTVDLTDGGGEIDYRGGALALDNWRCATDLGEVQFAARAGVSTPTTFAAELPHAQLDLARFGPLLQADGLAVSGSTTGRIAITNAGNAPEELSASFDLSTESPRVSSLEPASQASRHDELAGAALRNFRLTGNAGLNLARTGQWWADAHASCALAVLDGGRVGRTSLFVPAWVDGTRMAGLVAEVKANRGNGPATVQVALQADRLALPRLPPMVSSGDAGDGETSAGEPIPGGALTLQKVSMTAVTGPGELQLQRFEMRFGSSGDVQGSLAFGGADGPRGTVIARNLEASSLQRLLLPHTIAQARLQGLIAAQVNLPAEIGGAGGARLRTVLTGGQVAAGGGVFPLDLARADLEATPDGSFKINEASAWTRGGRIEVQGSGSTHPHAPTDFAGSLRTDNLPANLLSGWPNLGAWEKDSSADGVVSGDLTINAGRTITVQGPVQARLATIYGFDISGASAQVALSYAQGATTIKVAEATGQVEGAPFAGDLAADTAAGTWNLHFKTSGLSTTQVARARSILPDSLPLSGNIAVNVAASGSLFDQGQLNPRATDGTIHCDADDLQWDGQPFGHLAADLGIENGVPIVQKIVLNRPEGNGAPLLDVEGTMPVSADDASLNAHVAVADAPLPFVFESIGRLHSLLDQAHHASPLFDRITNFVGALPAGATGDVQLAADLTGQWSHPLIKVTSLQLQNGQAEVPLGGMSPPTTLDSAFTFQDGEFQVAKAEFKIKKPASDTADVDDTLVEVSPGGHVQLDGPVDLSMDVYNANLSELATWVPALVGKDGRPVLSGNVSEFSFHVQGTTQAPEVQGSVQADKLVMGTYLLDALQISQFQIQNGYLSVAPGFLLMQRGSTGERYSSNSAWGRIPWSWNPVGPDFNRPFEVHFPVKRRDFGALAGAFVSTVLAADASDFEGSVDVTGTLAKPMVSGQLTVRDGTFRLDPLQPGLQVGVAGLDGTVRFVFANDANHFEIDADDPLRGRLVQATAVQPQAGRRITGPRDAETPDVEGNFRIGGDVLFPADLQIGDLLRPTEIAGLNHYNLQLELNGGKYSSPQLSGIQNVDAGLTWETDPAPAGSRFPTQRLRWMLAAQPSETKKGRDLGEMDSRGQVELRPDFATSRDSFLASTPEDFTSDTGLAAMKVAARLSPVTFPDAQPQVLFKAFTVSASQTGSGQMDGRLILDDRESLASPAVVAATTTDKTLAGQLHASRTSPFDPGSLLHQAPEAGNRDYLLSPPLESEAGSMVPLRLAGTLTLSNAEFNGIPAESGFPVSLSLLPPAPNFDVTVGLGKNVQISTSSLHAGLAGTVAITGSAQNPIVQGKLSIFDGQVHFPNARASIDEGTVTISARRDPDTDGIDTKVDLDLTAKSTVGIYDITLRLQGPLDVGGANNQNLKIDLTSTPPLSQSEAFAQLLGTSDTDLTRRSDGTIAQSDLNNAYAHAMLGLVSAPVFSGVENSIAQALGLSNVGVDYQYNEPLAIDVSKNLGAHAVITYQQAVGGAAAGVRPPYQITLSYRIKGNLLVGVQIDEQDVTTVSIEKNYRF